MQMKRNNTARGSTTIEYLVVLAGILAVWAGAEVILNVLNEHQGELSWALSLPL